MEEQEKAGIQDKLVWTTLLLGIGFFVGYFIADRKASRLWFDIGYRECHKKLTGRQPDILPFFPRDR
ncbi:MAG: hypothetical protein FVQ82_02740 [Planctomycetes bacterium]|nr:hypothetical protein [Planctomycetota bacterium]